MGNITVVMSVCGHEDYFRYASLSIPSFFDTGNEGLIVFSDKPEKLSYLINYYPKLKLLNFNLCLDSMKDIENNLNEKTDSGMKQFTYYSRIHKHFFVSMLLPIAQEVVATEYILKIDSDGFFVGKGYIDAVEKEIESDYDLYLVERLHPAMHKIGNRPYPGVGFTMWKKQSDFIKTYINKFWMDEQRTVIEKIYWPNALNIKILKHPGFHFVYPFRKNPNFSKVEAAKYLPAYFHLGADTVYRNMIKLKGWFG